MELKDSKMVLQLLDIHLHWLLLLTADEVTVEEGEVLVVGVVD